MKIWWAAVVVVLLLSVPAWSDSGVFQLDCPPDCPRGQWALDGAWMIRPATGEAQTPPLEPSAWQDCREFIAVPGYWDQEPDLAAILGAASAESKYPELDGVCWYACWLQPTPEIVAATRSWLLDFGAVSAQARVWLNGQYLGQHRGAFTPFQLTIPEGLIQAGKNLLVVEVTDLGACSAHEPPLTLGGLGGPRGGITRPVQVSASGPAQVQGITTRLTGTRLELELKTVSRIAGCRALISARNMIDGATLLEAIGADIPAGTQVSLITLPPLEIERWSPENPHLYEFTITLLEAGAEIDRATQLTGFRDFDTQDGRLLLNGQPVYLRGVNLWLPVLEQTDRALARRYLELLKQAGVNAVRFPCDPPAAMWLELTDQIGFLALVSLPLDGQVPASAWLADPSFQQQVQAEMTELLSSRAQHPSIVIWSLGNELGSLPVPPGELRAMLEAMTEQARALDNSRLLSVDLGDCRGSVVGDLAVCTDFSGWYRDTTVAGLHNYSFGPPTKQPLLITECVGAYLLPDRDEFLPGLSQQSAGWRHIGRTAPVRTPAWYHAWLTGRAMDILRNIRGPAATLSGQFIQVGDLYLQNLRNAAGIAPRQPGHTALARANAPLTLAIDHSQLHFEAGKQAGFSITISNDLGSASPVTGLRIDLALLDATGRQRAQSAGWVAPAVPATDNAWVTCTLDLPPELETGQYRLSATMTGGEIQPISREVDIFVAQPKWAQEPLARVKGIKLACLHRRIRAFLEAAGVQSSTWDAAVTLATGEILLLDARWIASASPEQLQALGDLVADGATVVALGSADMHPYQLLSPAYAWDALAVFPNGFAEILEPDHAAFDGLDRDALRNWNGGRNVVASAAMYAPKSANIHVLASTYRWNREETWPVLVDICHGQGRILATTLDIADRIDSDPVAARLLGNLLAAGSQPAWQHQAHEMAVPLYRFELGTPADEAFVREGWDEPERAWPIHFRRTRARNATVCLPVLPGTTNTITLRGDWLGAGPLEIKANDHVLGRMTPDQHEVQLLLTPQQTMTGEVTLAFEECGRSLRLVSTAVQAQLPMQDIHAQVRKLRNRLLRMEKMNLCAAWSGAWAMGGMQLEGIGPERAIDGLASDYGPHYGLAETTHGGEIQITLPRPLNLERVHVLVYDEPGQGSRFILEGLDPSGHWRRLAAQTAGEQSGWVICNFPPVVCSALRLLEAGSDTEGVLRVVEVQAFGSAGAQP